MKLARSLVTSSLAIVAAFGSGSAMAQEQALEGTFALPNAEQEVSGEMVVRDTGPLSRELELSYSDLDTGAAIANFDVELTQELHVLATDSGLSHLVHEHVKAASADGIFTTELHFPEPGRYHIYTDAVPSGVGQQVLRFDLQVGEGGNQGPQSDSGMAERPANVEEGPITSSDAGYTVVLDASDLEAGAEGKITLTVEKDGEAATDLEPYLGVAAHAVFVRAEDLAYVHAHAMADGGEAHGEHGNTAEHSTDAGDHGHGGASTGHAEHGTAMSSAAEHGHEDTVGKAMHGTMDHGSMDHESMGSMPHVSVSADEHAGHGSDEGGAAQSVSPEMTIHVTPPAPGAYSLWIEFIGGGEVVTVPFALEIPESK
ncbi:hypothetical protein [Devosia sp. RR2S18]|uniref:hypothetical protein n=1 Tax=Devosia rhizosphaerae TaxID=3049774 RepID=UPI002540E33E|nr:hypothetical protein [Devosia sp. RR2S18]WIJ26963.1 hypothetical protein QOV41_09540 [Devosia sp. RR2S18]